MDANCVAIHVPRLSVCLSWHALMIYGLKMRQPDVEYIQTCYSHFRPIQRAESKIAVERTLLKEEPNN